MKGMNWTARWAWAGVASVALCGTPVLAQPAKQKAATATTIPPGKTVATVNGEAIPYSRLDPLVRQAGTMPADMPEAHRRELYREALSMIVDDVLLTQYLKQYVPDAPKAAVDRKMAELAAGLKDKKMTVADLCKESNQTEAELRANIAEHLQWAAYAEKHVSEASLQQYHASYKDFFDKIQVRASHIFLRLPAATPDAEKAAGHAKLQQLRALIVEGKLDFAAAAKEHSQCPSAASGGDIGTFPRKFVVDEGLARAAFSMKPGAISDVVQTDFGLHLVKVTERTPGQPSEFSKIKDEVREYYLEDLKQTILTRSRKDAKIDIHLP